MVVTGSLGPGSNAHGPNENLDIQATKNLICSLTQVVTECYEHLTKGK